jgi:hypothetical protein
MNEEHVLAAILTAGLTARSADREMTPKDVVGLYGAVLAELLNAVRPPRPAQPTG